MTLDDFLRTLETLIDDRESTDDPGEGNFGCEDCRKCNHCRFCMGCDSCEDCTYCEESIDCTSCTQSKRCVGCTKVSYCEDCRDCRSSRYLTLCVDCDDCVHCLACVGLDGAEFYVLNEKRTRKEYFALLRQVQALMQQRMEAGWRPPGIGLASDVDDPIVAGRDVELNAAPWLDDGREPEPQRLPHEARLARRHDYDARDDYEARERPGRAAHGYEPRRREFDREFDRAPYPEPEPPRRAPLRPDRGEPDDRRRPLRGSPGRYLDSEPREPEPERRRVREPMPEAWDHEPRRRDPDFDTDAPRAHEQQPTKPFGGRSGARARVREYDPEPEYDDELEREREQWTDEWEDRPLPRAAGWADSRERTVARPAQRSARPEHDAPPIEDDLVDDRDHEPSSPWLDEEAQAQARRRAKRGSLRRAGRPKRKAEPEPEPPREATGSGSYRTGSAPARTASEGTHTGTGLRLGRKPKRR